MGQSNLVLSMMYLRALVVSELKVEDMQII